LTLHEGRGLIDEVARMGTPVFILTGGDPLQREDLEELIRHAVARGLRVGTIPACTERLTRPRIDSLKAAGVHQVALSIDGSTAALHDAFRGVDGSFERALRGAEWIRSAGLPFQVNTVLGSWNFDDVENLSALVARLGVVFWEVFFLVPTGRGAALEGCTAEQYEELFAYLYSVSRKADFVVKVTEAPHYRRYLAQRDARLEPVHHRGRRTGPAISPSPLAVNSGKGYCFVDHVGGVYPSGFLPLPTGNVRTASVADLYREHPLFLALRDTSRLKGRCGRCSYRDICGGSRARAYAMTGDHLAEDPCCVYVP
jgi:radical SAM protein